MKEFIHYLRKLFLKFGLHIFWIFPVEKNRLFLINELSFTYGDSLKYLNEYIMHNDKKQYQVIFALKHGIYGPSNITIVKPFSINYFYYLMTSQFIFTNAGGVSYLPIRKRKQLVVSTWHGGGPYKKTSVDVFHNKWYQREVKMNADNIDYILSSCKFFTDYEAKSMGFSKEKCISSGTPRNDLFWHTNKKIRKKLFDSCNIPITKKCVLYAPTYRENVDDFTAAFKINEIDIDFERLKKALEAKFGGEWVVGIRLHPKLSTADLKYDNIINFSDYPDMQELLYSVDVVITDYSSLMWDFSFTKRPCFLYANDLEEYEEKRGFYMPSAKWPYPIAHDNDELEENIVAFDYDNYLAKLTKHYEESGSYESGNACRIVMNLLEGKRGEQIYE